MRISPKLAAHHAMPELDEYARGILAEECGTGHRRGAHHLCPRCEEDRRMAEQYAKVEHLEHHPDFDFEWGELPPELPRGGHGAKGRTPYKLIVPLLRSRPDQWARIRTLSCARSAATGVRILKRLGCDANMRGTEVWASWPREADQ